MRLQPGGELFASLRCFSACHGLAIARARLENHPPQPHRFGRITALLGQDGEIAEGEMTVDALIDAAELVASLSPLATRHSPLPPHSLATDYWPLATVLGPLGQLGIEDLAIALEFPFPQRRVGVAGVPDVDIGPAHRHIRPPQGRQDLLVHRVCPAHILTHRIPDFFSAPFNADFRGRLTCLFPTQLRPLMRRFSLVFSGCEHGDLGVV
jgi:hypothetical protein